MPPHAATISDGALNICFILSSKPLKLFHVNRNRFHTMFKALKLFSLNLLKIAYCIFVAKIMVKSMSAETESSKFFQHSGKISLSKIIEP
jgi:hypothetical protein